MKKNFLVLMAASLAVFSCKKNEKADVYIDQSAPANVAATPVNTDSVSVAPSADPQIVPTPQNGANTQTTVVPTVSAPTQVVQTAPGMNPPHGQPGHRCDIAVGAPLNSPPAATANPVTEVAKPTNNIPPTIAAPQPAPNTSVAAGPKPATNPAHGLPHHRCDLEVGAPLP